MLRNRRLVSVVFIVLFAATQVAAQEQQTVMIKGRVVTGTNRFLEQPLTDFGAPLGTVGFSNIAAHNPSGGQPIPLTPDTPLSARLATYVDPVFLDFIGMTPADVDPAKLNILIQDVPVNVDPVGSQRSPLKGILQSSQAQPSLAEPSTHIILADWMQAQGTALIKCWIGGIRANTIKIALKGFLPNRLYTIWAILGGNELTPLPLGGLPNAIVTDSHGNASFERVLNFCPFRVKPGDRPLLLIDVVFHSDQQLYGAVPDLPFASLFTGTINHTQYEFQIMGTSVQLP